MNYSPSLVVWTLNYPITHRHWVIWSFGPKAYTSLNDLGRCLISMTVDSQARQYLFQGISVAVLRGMLLQSWEHGEKTVKTLAATFLDLGLKFIAILRKGTRNNNNNNIILKLWRQLNLLVIVKASVWVCLPQKPLRTFSRSSPFSFGEETHVHGPRESPLTCLW